MYIVGALHNVVSISRPLLSSSSFHITGVSGPLCHHFATLRTYKMVSYRKNEMGYQTGCSILYYNIVMTLIGQL